VFLSIGCGQTLQKSWSNFRAYYNTYYNAKKNYDAGFEKVKEQNRTIDPYKPVRIHPPPLQAGNSDFEEAIEKSAKILRKYSNSKWVDESLLLIGKSYYYQQKYYPALQKFEELYKASSSPKMNQLAIIWKGRTLLDLGQYDKGASFLESELEKYPSKWSLKNKGEIESLAGEHYALSENWDQSADFLSRAISHIEEKKLLGRTFFLYGQVLEQLERYGEAYYSYSKVQENFPGFEYAYWAAVKQADVARKEGNLDVAISIYEKLRKDDKNFQRRDALMYEIARTLEMKGENDEAERRYKALLHDEEGTQSRSLKSDIYYRLGKINSDIYNNFGLAAAYFDSSSSIRESRESGESQDAGSLADAFDTYNRLQRRIQHSDSLLWLGSLSTSELDSVIEEIRIRKRNELLAKQQESNRNTMANREFQESGGATKSSIYGFLNYRSAKLVQNEKNEFRIVWGDRPLVDNWRRIEAVQQADVDAKKSTVPQKGDRVPVDLRENMEGIELNVDEIPRTEEQRNKLQTEKAKAQYQLGNLFFLNLSSPDSARNYFYRVINSGTENDLSGRAMYSLFELFNTANQPDSLTYWGNKILKQYPDSKYAQRVRKRLGKSMPVHADKDSSQTLNEEYRLISESKDPNKGGKLRRLALDNPNAELSPYIYYQAIEWYISRAKSEEQIADSLQKNVSESSTDSLSTGFEHVSWDSVRFVLQEFDTTYTNAPQKERVSKLLEALGQNKSAQTEGLPTCHDLGTSLTVMPGMKEFLSSVSWPDEIENQSLTGRVVYSFVVNSDGSWQSYQLVTSRTSLGIEDALESAFGQYLHFAPLQGKDLPNKIRCRVEFQINR
jgi:tetratricopeptide (TPR) repeat protein